MSGCSTSLTEPRPGPCFNAPAVDRASRASFTREAAGGIAEHFLTAAQVRLAPILMTAMAAGLALIPLAMGGGQSGSEIQTPMAIVILCGLITSTLLNNVRRADAVPALRPMSRDAGDALVRGLESLRP